MNSRPLSSFLPPRSWLAVLAGLLLTAFAARAQGPDDLPPPGDAPPPPPPMDLTQMPLDVTPAPFDPRAQQQQQQQAQGSAQPASSPGQQRTPPPPPNFTPPPNRYQRRPNGNTTNAAATTPAPSPNVSVPAAPATPVPVVSPLAPGAGLRLNFQNASLLDVLNYLSAAAGFIITQETPVAGTVNVVSQQPVTADEAVDFLSSLMAEKGYAVIRNGRILKIVALQDAPKRGDVPVYVGQEPKDIPRKDNMVTQIIPVRYAEVGKLVDNLRPLLSNSATISSNDSSNAIIITDTQTNIHRLAEIIHALDTSISGISQIRVFTLRYSDSKGLADVLTQLFSPQQRNNGNNQIPGIPPQFQRFAQQQFAAAAANASPQSEARQAASRVVAVSDDTSNSIIVAAPEEVMATVADVIAQLDTSTSDITETQIFRLLHADATELAAELSNLYADTGSTPTGNNNNNRGGNNPFRGPQPQNNSPAAGTSARALAQARVVIVADARTNSVLVSASHDTMAQIGLTVGRLDSNKAKKQHVYVYTLNHADPDNMATILRGMYSTTNNGTNGTNGSNNNSTQPSISALANRTQNGASSDITGTLNTNSNRSTTGR